MKHFFFTISVLSSFPVFALLFLLFFFFSSSWFFLPFGLMFFMVMIISYLVKWLYPTLRPKKKRSSLPKKKTLWNHWRFVDRSSFPSAHMARMIGLTTVSFFFNNWFIIISLMVFSIFVAYSRIFLKEHFWYDIVAGLVLGLLSGLFALWAVPLLSVYF